MPSIGCSSAAIAGDDTILVICPDSTVAAGVRDRLMDLLSDRRT